MNRSDKPYEPLVRLFVQDAIAQSGKTVEEIALEIGYSNAAPLRTLLSGKSFLEVDKIKPFAAATRVDAARVLGVVLEEYMPGIRELIAELLQPETLSKSEQRLLEALRVHTNGAKAEAVVCDARDVVAVVMV
jgi:hypothetical protein